MAAAGLTLLTQVLLARSMSVTDFGHMTQALAFIAVATPFAGFGVDALLLKLFGLYGWHAVAWMPAIIKYISISVGFVALAALVSGFFWMISHSEFLLVLFLIPTILGSLSSGIVGAKFQLEEKFASLSAWSSLSAFFRCLWVAVLSIIFTERLNSVWVALGYSFVAMVLTAYACRALMQMRIGNFFLKGHGEYLKPDDGAFNEGSLSVAVKSSVFGLSGIFYLIYYQSNILILGRLVSGAAVGIYSVAALLVGATYLFPVVVFQKFLLPRLHRWTNENMEQIKEIYWLGTLGMAISGVFASLVIFLGSPFVVEFLFGVEYKNSLAILNVLVFCVPARFISSSADAVLTSGSQLHKKVQIQFAAAFFIVILGFLYIPDGGEKMAAYLAVATEVMMALALHGAAWRYLYIKSNKNSH